MRDPMPFELADIADAQVAREHHAVARYDPIREDVADLFAGRLSVVEDSGPARKARITWANTITPEPVVWGWVDDGAGRMPMGSLAVAAGREGTGKSQFALWLAARITRGQLPGELLGQPRRVLIVTTEDSWSRTIVPRLIAAGADLALVGRFDVVTEVDAKMTLSLPVDTHLLGEAVADHQVALVILDPMLSVIDATLDDFRSRQVRTALEPLVEMAEVTNCLFLGIAHFNKGEGKDVATLLSGSHAFRDLPRALFGFAKNEDERVFSQVKNSLGRDDLPSLSYEIEPMDVETPTGISHVSRYVPTGISSRAVSDVLGERGEDREDVAIRNACQVFLLDYLMANNLAVPASKAIAAAQQNGFTVDQAKLARARMRHPRVISEKTAMGSGWQWRVEASDDE